MILWLLACVSRVPDCATDEFAYSGYCWDRTELPTTCEGGNLWDGRDGAIQYACMSCDSADGFSICGWQIGYHFNDADRFELVLKGADAHVETHDDFVNYGPMQNIGLTYDEDASHWEENEVTSVWLDDSFTFEISAFEDSGAVTDCIANVSGDCRLVSLVSD